MKPQIILIVILVALFSILVIGHRPAQAAALPAAYANKAVSSYGIAAPPSQVDPPVSDDGISWALKMLFAFLGLSAGSIVLNYLWMQSVKPQRTRTQ